MDAQKNKQCAMALGGTLLRLGLGMLFTVAALGKFLGPGYLGFARSMQESFAKTWLPGLLVAPFAYVLPLVETAVGILLLVGLFTRPTLVVTGLLLIVLAFGMMVQGNGTVVAANLNYVLLVAVTLVLLAESNPYSIDAMMKK